MLSYNKTFKDFTIGVNAGGSMMNSSYDQWMITPIAKSGAPYTEDLSCNQFVLSDIYLNSSENYGGLTTKNWERAKTYCRLYLTRGTKAGDWFMPDFLQMFPIDKMQNRRINARTFLHINDRLALVKEARALKEDVYMTSSDYADDKKAAIGINLTTGELVKLKKKGRHAFRCMMSF